MDKVWCLAYSESHSNQIKTSSNTYFNTKDVAEAEIIPRLDEVGLEAANKLVLANRLNSLKKKIQVRAGNRQCSCKMLLLWQPMRVSLITVGNVDIT
jgi:hypothetical protein